MTAQAVTPHPIDHLVLPTVGLAVARRRLTDLGFSVAPDGIHPFGTANCCVFLADGTYLEPLAVVDRVAVAEAVSAGNVFIERDRRFREHHGNEGFTAVVLSTQDAAADHRRYVDVGLSAGGMLEFSRAFVDPSGRSETASFRLAFAAEIGASESFCFACQRVNAPKVDRSALERHANGAVRLNGISAVSDGPARSAAFFAAAAGDAEHVVSGNTHRVVLPNAWIDVFDSDGFDAMVGIHPEPAGGTRFAAIFFGVADLGAAEAPLRANSVECHRHGDRLVVPPAPGQGATFIFEDRS